MKRLEAVKALGVGLFLVTSIISPAITVFADTEPEPELIFTEIKIRNDTAGFDEFIEIYNPTNQDVSLNDYFINYINTPAPADNQQFDSVVIGAGLLPAGQSFVLAKNSADPNLPMSEPSPFSSLSDSGGTLTITNSDNEILDQFSWTSTQNLAIDPIRYLSSATTTKSQSFTRGKDIDGKYVIVNTTWQLANPTPLSSELVALPEPVPELVPDQAIEPTPEPIPDVVDSETNQDNATEPLTPPSETVEEPAPVLLLQITELLPNPAPPQTDSDDEYIELYNPNNQPVDLSGHKLQSGSSYSYSHIFENVTIEPFSYRSFPVTETGTVLSNTAGQARLLDSLGRVVAQTNAYESADEGDAWAFINGVWQWTSTPTPGAANVMALPVLKVATAKLPVAKKTSVAKAPAKKAAPKASAKVASAKTKAAKPAAERAVYEDPAVADIAPIHPNILVGVGVATLVYAVYEYRHDAINRLQQLRRYRDIRRATRAAAKGQ